MLPRRAALGPCWNPLLSSTLKDRSPLDLNLRMTRMMRMTAIRAPAMIPIIKAMISDVSELTLSGGRGRGGL